MKIALSAAAIIAALALAAPADAQRNVRCTVTGSGSSWSGPCLFSAERGGSFTISRRDRRVFPGGATSITVAVMGADAEVRGLTRDGINSRWGMASRDRRDRACWIGSDFRVCAY
jgi:hypothetical protein